MYELGARRRVDHLVNFLGYLKVFFRIHTVCYPELDESGPHLHCPVFRHVCLRREKCVLLRVHEFGSHWIDFRDV